VKEKDLFGGSEGNRVSLVNFKGGEKINLGAGKSWARNDLVRGKGN